MARIVRDRRHVRARIQPEFRIPFSEPDSSVPLDDPCEAEGLKNRVIEGGAGFEIGNCN